MGRPRRGTGIARRRALKEMTQRQREVLAFMRSFSDRHGAPPTVREIAERFRFTPRAAFDHLRALERKGELQRRGADKRGARAPILTPRAPPPPPPPPSPLLRPGPPGRR